jgi:hypothetical protein
MCGASTNDITLYFAVVGIESAYFCFWGVELKYCGQMNSLVYVIGGTVCFEGVKMDKQESYYWVNPLIVVNATVSPVDVHILLTNITNSNYNCFNTSTTQYKSGVVFIVNTSTKVIILNIRASSFLNDSFYLSSNSYARGGVCMFQGSTQSGLFFIVCLFILLFFCL